MSMSNRIVKVGLTVVLATATVACTRSSGPGVDQPTPPRQEATGCPLGVYGALATAEETDQGVALTFLGTADRVEELRARAHDAGALHGPDAHLGRGHAGSHGQGAQHGLQAMQLPPVRATVVDIEAGARITLVAVDTGDREALAKRAHDGVRRMNASACR